MCTIVFFEQYYDIYYCYFIIAFPIFISNFIRIYLFAAIQQDNKCAFNIISINA